MQMHPVRIRRRRSALGAALAAVAIVGLAAPCMAQSARPPAARAPQAARPAQAPGPTGLWMVEKGLAIINVVDCGGHLWGVVAWEKRPGIDRYNSDPAKRGRPTLGMAVLIDMKQVGRNEWDGTIYNSNDGRSYASKISLSGRNVLQVRGCMLGFLCGGQDWTRVPEGNAAYASTRPPQEVCSRLLGRPGTSHQGGLKQNRGAKRTDQR
jgi:uncharacterized protein (DUF2147 family)